MLLTLCLLLLLSAFPGSGDLARLDSLILKQEAMSTAYVDSLSRLSNPDPYTYNRMMYEAYSVFCYDSAYHYLSKNIELSDELSNERRLQNDLDLLRLLSAAGLFLEAEQVKVRLEQAMTSGVTFTERQQVLFFRYSCDLYLHLSEYTHSPYSERYMCRHRRYRKQLLEVTPTDSYEHAFALATARCDEGQYDEAISLIEDLLPSLHSGTRIYSVMSSTLAYFYLMKGDRQMQKLYLIRAAQSDLEGNIRETSALRALAVLLYNEGDIVHASTYLYISVNDAKFYGSRLRTYQTGSLTPMMASAWQREQSRSSRLMVYLLLGALLLLVILVSAVAVVYSSLRKVRRTQAMVENQNRQISDINRQLSEQNLQIKESNKIRLEYISRFMRLSSSYITETERLRRHLSKLMTEGKHAEVAKLLRQNDNDTKNVQLFQQNFDSAFLNIYPTFLQEVNRLLRDDCRIELKGSERMTTELRICALIRLGISDNQQIAEILRSSITTIYTYRSRLRQKAVNPDTFAADILRIDAALEG